MNFNLASVNYFTETALLKVSNYIYMAADAADCSVLVLLDLSAAFDTVDHHILIHRLSPRGYFRDCIRVVLFLSHKSFSVSVGELVKNQNEWIKTHDSKDTDM